MITANMHDAKTRLSALVKAALDGEDVVLCSNGEPKVRLVPVPPTSIHRDLTPDPRLKPVLMPGYDPVEPLSDEEWPSQ